jgi:uronate dehydrogenase
LPVLHCDLTDFESTLDVLSRDRFDAVVNCAIADYRGINWDDPESVRGYYERCIEINARGSYHLLEAASRTQVGRCVYISSLTAVMGRPLYDFVSRDAAPRPRDLYSVSKLFGEQLGETYAHRESNALRVLCLRLGQPYPSFTDSDEKWNENEFSRAIMVHSDDIAQAIAGALRADVSYGVYPIISRSDSTWIDTSRSEEIGYVPRWNFTAQGIRIDS